MLGISPKPGNTIDFDILRSFRNLAACGKVPPGSKPRHSDGWGVVVWKEGLPIYLGREPNDAFTDPIFEGACAAGEKLNVSTPLIAHLRKASVGVKTKENTHPFTLGEWAFAHNGTIRKMNLKFTTDSEWFFKSIMHELAISGSIVGSIVQLVEFVRSAYPYTSITFLLSNGKDLYAYRDCARNEGYYTLYYAELAGAYVVAQEKFFEADWKELENGKLLIIENRKPPSVISVSEPVTIRSSSTKLKTN
jgi:predicted glutamine amidotransferase